MKNLVMAVLSLSVFLPTTGFSAEMVVTPRSREMMQPNTRVTPRVLFGPTERLANEPVAQVFRKNLIDYFHTRYPSTNDTTNLPDHEVKIVVKSLKVEPAKETNPASVDMLIKISVRRGSNVLGTADLPIKMDAQELNDGAFQSITQEAVSQVHEYLQRVGI